LYEEKVLTVYEIGFFKDNLSILNRKYYPMKNVTDDFSPERRSQVINLILELSKLVLSKKITTFTNEYYRVFFATIYTRSNPDKDIQHLFVYAIGDMSSSEEVLMPLLQSLLHKFIQRYGNEISELVEDVSKYSSFSPIIDDVLLDERLTPGDRVKVFLFNGIHRSH
jgi:hypothetical protein